MITQARLKELFHYDPETGVFVRLVTTGPRSKAGMVAGSNNGNGTGETAYLRIMVDRKLYLAHRLAFLYMTGNLPVVYLDHVNGIRYDNRWCNLREASIEQNTWNCVAHRNNTSGVKGVSVCYRSGKFRATFREQGRQIGLGYYNTIEEAAAVVRKKREELHGEFANHG